VNVPFSGRCVCEAVRYRVGEAPIMFYACHCTDCQKRSGSAFNLSMWVQRAAIEVTQGEAALVELQSTLGRKTLARVCQACGTRLWSESAKRPEVAILRPGTLDDTKSLEPVGHIWVRSAQPWVKIPQDEWSFETQPEKFTLLADAWRARHPA
jgi:hypothetical protein